MDALFCERCHRPLGSVVEVAQSVIPTERQLQKMNYRECLQWAADRDGILSRSRLIRLAKARDYDTWWVQRCAGRHWQDVLEAARDWQTQQMAERERQ